MGGNSPQSLVNQTCLDIQAGRADLVLIGGAEAWRTRMAARAGNAELGWTVQGDDVAQGPPLDAGRGRCPHPASRPAAC